MKHQYAVIGLGSFGSTVALELTRLGHDVLGIDSDASRVEYYADQLSQTLIADGASDKVVEELDLPAYDAVVVAIGENLEASILTTLALKNAKVKQVWVKAISEAHHRILFRLGADRIIHPEHEMGIRVAQTLLHPEMLDYIPLGNDWLVVEVKVDERFADQPAVELPLEDHDLRLTLVKRGTEVWQAPFTDLVLRERDQLVLLGTMHNLLRFAKKQ
ncbi:potassium uptake protein TrkA [Alcanivorax hongdengensis A-11-3]|uniref:Potassium uptake protein TrkA n=1 Tax=Alcanivorax hongdengensis A-11-3 TaxID=1177179 RepID=L0WD90_9GAMM|nr:TrkA family potassium uptake protein [Alcanivorax hongdengensis]EKF74728.1 potassium uptake protein TrkA [Alcanivorax hongdengensis A-11-3]